jgi:hypothetical protein
VKADRKGCWWRCLELNKNLLRVVRTKFFNSQSKRF